MRNTEKLSAMKIMLNSREIVQDKADGRSRHYTAHQFGYNRPSSMTKMTFIANLLPKLLFFIPFGAVLILAGFLCLKSQNVTLIAPSLSNFDNYVQIDSHLNEQFKVNHNSESLRL